MSYPPIEDHGIIGNRETAALVRKDGAIDFMCFPRFDSPTIFASLLDAEKGGLFQIEPDLANCQRRQAYRPNTNILDTIFRTADAIAVISDFITVEPSGGGRRLMRRVETVQASVSFRALCAPRFGYGRSGHKVEKKSGGLLFVPNHAAIPPMLLRASVSLKQSNGDAEARFCLGAGQSAWFILDEYSSDLPSADADSVLAAFNKTRQYWESWAARCTYRGRWPEMVNRSALTLALLMSRRDGAIVAAPTFGLPEWPGADRNWDYRYTWVRDASFALEAFLKLGYLEEAQAIIGWMEQRCRELMPEKPLQVVYRLNGERKLTEQELAHLDGYKRSKPVRIGNAAGNQLQLDIYGEFLNSVFLYDQRTKALCPESWRRICSLVEWVCHNWQRADDSIWESRDGARPYLYSRAMCWVALDRALKLAQHRSFSAPLDQWAGTREDIYKTICPSFWNAKLNSFMQYHGAEIVDASSLLLPRFEVFNSTDARWRSTLQAIENHLVDDCFVYRSGPASFAKGSDKATKGTFSACSFWYVEALVRENQPAKAKAVFEKFLTYANELGLYSEQLGPQREHLGNFPQALSHISLIRAACDLDEAQNPAPQA